MEIDDIIQELLDDDLNINIVHVAINELAVNQILQPNDSNRNKNYYEETVANYSPDDFRAHFRMNRETFQVLFNALGPLITEEHKIPLQKKILFSIWCLAKQESFLSVGDRFDFAKSTAHKIFFEVVNAIANLRNGYIQWPNEQKRQQISRRFSNKCGISGIIGAIDGCHIEIKAPVNNPVDFYNRNDYHSIVLQAVCDNTMLFTDIFVGCPGRMHDARVFNLSPLFEALSNQQIISPDQHLIGDAAYPLTLFLMKPFRDNGHLDNVQIHFNVCLSRARSTIERAFGQLKGKFRRLKYLDMSRDDMIPVVITAACVLHNIIIKNEQIGNDDFNDDNPCNDNQNDLDNNNEDLAANAAAQHKRNALAESLQ